MKEDLKSQWKTTKTILFWSIYFTLLFFIWGYAGDFVSAKSDFAVFIGTLIYVFVISAWIYAFRRFYRFVVTKQDFVSNAKKDFKKK